MWAQMANVLQSSSMMMRHKYHSHDTTCDKYSAKSTYEYARSMNLVIEMRHDTV